MDTDWWISFEIKDKNHCCFLCNNIFSLALSDFAIFSISKNVLIKEKISNEKYKAFIIISDFQKYCASNENIDKQAIQYYLKGLKNDYKVVEFSLEHNTYLQIFESFIWTFGDSVSIMLISLCLLLLFSDVPSMDNDVPFFLVRTSRIVWIFGQIVYVIEATFIFMIFIMLSTCIISSANAYFGNFWSETAAILGYSTIGEKIAVPAFVNVLEFSFPLQVSVKILLLTTGYSLLLSSIISYFNLFKFKNEMIAGVIFSGLGYFLTPEIISNLFRLSQYQQKYANILFGWLSPLNQATYYMHNFGYDSLPRIWQSYLT